VKLARQHQKLLLQQVPPLLLLLVLLLGLSCQQLVCLVHLSPAH